MKCDCGMPGCKDCKDSEGKSDTKGKKDRIEDGVSKMVQNYRKTGKVGKAKPKAVDNARRAALAKMQMEG